MAPFEKENLDDSSHNTTRKLRLHLPTNLHAGIPIKKKGKKNSTSHKGSWAREEDDLLTNIVQRNGQKGWSKIAKQLKGRTGKQCRERWYNHLDPAIRKDPWTPEEDKLIIEMHDKIGNKWAEIAKLLNGRPSNTVKNHWHSALKKTRTQRAVADILKESDPITYATRSFPISSHLADTPHRIVGPTIQRPENKNPPKSNLTPSSDLDNVPVPVANSLPPESIPDKIENMLENYDEIATVAPTKSNLTQTPPDKPDKLRTNKKTKLRKGKCKRVVVGKIFFFFFLLM